MPGEFTIANFKHVAGGVQAGRFAIGERRVLFVRAIDRLATFGEP